MAEPGWVRVGVGQLPPYSQAPAAGPALGPPGEVNAWAAWFLTREMWSLPSLSFAVFFKASVNVPSKGASEQRSPFWRTLGPSELLESSSLPPFLWRHGSSMIAFRSFSTKELFPLTLARPTPCLRAAPLPRPCRAQRAVQPWPGLSLGLLPPARVVPQATLLSLFGFLLQAQGMGLWGIPLLQGKWPGH